MNVGDLLIDSLDVKWIIFDFSDKFIYVIDFETQKLANAFSPKDTFVIESKPENLEYMFIKRRQFAMLNFFKGMA